MRIGNICVGTNRLEPQASVSLADRLLEMPGKLEPDRDNAIDCS